VLFLAPEGQIMSTPIVEYVDDELILHFAPRIQNVKEWDTLEELNRPDIGLLPLLPLTADGRNIDLVDEMFERLEQSQDTLLIDVAAILAAYAFELYDGDITWLLRRVKQLKDVDIDNLILFKEWREKWKQEGLEKGLTSLLHPTGPLPPPHPVPPTLCADQSAGYCAKYVR